MFGLPNNLSYATAKAGVIGLTRSLTDRRRRARHQGQPHRARGIHAHGRPRDEGAGQPTQMAPELVAPMVAFLAHEDCPVSGEIYAAGAGRFARIFIASTEGYVHRRVRADDGGRRPELGDDQRRNRLLVPPTSSPGQPPS